MYDTSVPQIVQKFNASAANYSLAMLPWAQALRQRFPEVCACPAAPHRTPPHPAAPRRTQSTVTAPAAPPQARLALCGGNTAPWMAEVMASETAKVVHAVTSHVYTKLPEGPYHDLYDYLGVIDQAATANESIALMHAASVPADKEVRLRRGPPGAGPDANGLAPPLTSVPAQIWFTEVGAYGAMSAQNTWLKALFALRQVHVG